MGHSEGISAAFTTPTSLPMVNWNLKIRKFLGNLEIDKENVLPFLIYGRAWTYFKSKFTSLTYTVAIMKPLFALGAAWLSWRFQCLLTFSGLLFVYDGQILWKVHFVLRNLPKATLWKAKLQNFFNPSPSTREGLVSTQYEASAKWWW